MVEEQPKTIKEYFQSILPRTQPEIVNTTINFNNFKLKPGLIQIAKDIAFKGRPTDDSRKLLWFFIEICGTVKINEVTNDVMRLRLFSFSLQD